MSSHPLKDALLLAGKSLLSAVGSFLVGVIWLNVISLPLLFAAQAYTAPASDERAWVVIGGLCLALAPVLLFTVRRFGGLAALSLTIGYLFSDPGFLYFKHTLIGLGHR